MGGSSSSSSGGDGGGGDGGAGGGGATMTGGASLHNGAVPTSRIMQVASMVTMGVTAAVVLLVATAQSRSTSAAATAASPTSASPLYTNGGSHEWTHAGAQYGTFQPPRVETGASL